MAIELDVPNLDVAEPDELTEFASALLTLGTYADCKAIAMRCRLAGRIEVAQRHERRCEQLYQMLPPSWRW